MFSMKVESDSEKHWGEFHLLDAQKSFYNAADAIKLINPGKFPEQYAFQLR